MSFLQSFEGGNIILDLNEVRMISGQYVLFKGTDKLYDIGKENADAVRKTFRYHSDEQQPEVAQ